LICSVTGKETGLISGKGKGDGFWWVAAKGTGVASWFGLGFSLSGSEAFGTNEGVGLGFGDGEGDGTTDGEGDGTTDGEGSIDADGDEDGEGLGIIVGLAAGVEV